MMAWLLSVACFRHVNPSIKPVVPDGSMYIIGNVIDYEWSHAENGHIFYMFNFSTTIEPVYYSNIPHSKKIKLLVVKHMTVPLDSHWTIIGSQFCLQMGLDNIYFIDTRGVLTVDVTDITFCDY